MLYYPSLHCEPTICHQKGSLTDKGHSISEYIIGAKANSYSMLFSANTVLKHRRGKMYQHLINWG